MNYIKENKNFNFKKFNDLWAIKSNGSYAIQCKNKKNALKIEKFLTDSGFIVDRSKEYIDWRHPLRKNFNIRVHPKRKYFYRTKDTLLDIRRFNNIYDESYFKNFSDKFVILEKNEIK